MCPVITSEDERYKGRLRTNPGRSVPWNNKNVVRLENLHGKAANTNTLHFPWEWTSPGVQSCVGTRVCEVTIESRGFSHVPEVTQLESPRVMRRPSEDEPVLLAEMEEPRAIEVLGKCLVTLEMASWGR